MMLVGSIRSILVLFLVLSLSCFANGKPRLQTPDEQLSLEESKDVKQFVRRFSSQLRITRDLTPFLTEPLASKMLDKLLLDQKDSVLPWVSSNLISAGNLNELREFWIASVNLAYLSELYVYTRFSVRGTRTHELPHEQQYPPGVVRLLKRNLIVSEAWKDSDSDSADQVAHNIEQLRALIGTLQKGAIGMRAYFKAHPPERTAHYRNNIRYLSRHFTVRNVHTCSNQEDCGGLPLNTRYVDVNIPVLTLMLVWINGQPKILVIGIIDD